MLLTQGLPQFLPQIEEVSENASKEYSLERTLDKMQAEWSGVKFDYMAWRSTGTYILRALDDIQMLLDDQVVKTQAMRASPYVGESVHVYVYMYLILRVSYCQVAK